MGYRTWLGSAATAVLILACGPAAPAAPLQATFPWVVTFATAPAPHNTWNAPWTVNPPTPAGSVTWTVETSGGASDASGDGGYYRAVRNAEGSSVHVLRYPVPAGTNLYFGCWMRCPDYDPTPGDNYWMEFGVHMGDPALPAGPVTTVGQHFDDPSTGGAWTVVKKFEHQMTGGLQHDNGNVWTWYYTAAPINTGANTVVNLGFKVGSHYETGPGTRPAYNPPTNVMDVGYDGLAVSNAPLTVPPGPGFEPPPGGGSGGGGTGGGGGAGGGGGGGGGGPASNGDNDNGDRSINDSCHCSVPAAGPSPGSLGLILALSLGVFLLRRR